MSRTEQEAMEKANAEIFKSVADTIDTIASDIRLEDYKNAKKKIDLLSALLKTLSEGTYKK